MTTVWMSTLTRGNSYHQPIGGRTPCGVYFGLLPDGKPLGGHLLAEDVAIEKHGARPCKRCSGEAVRVAPRIRRRAEP